MEYPFRSSRPGDICPLAPRCPPPGNLAYRRAPIMTERTFTIQEEKNVRCFHIHGGVFIRRDDYEELQGRLQSTFANSHPLPEPLVKLAIRSLWEGQSFVRVVEFRASNTRRGSSPYHEGRILAFHCK